MQNFWLEIKSIVRSIEEMNQHFATDGSEEPDPDDIVNSALLSLSRT